MFIAEFGVFLAEITVETSGALAIRQLASVLLKQYVHSHWSEHSDKFRVPETTEAVSNRLGIKTSCTSSQSVGGLVSRLYYEI